MDVMLYECPFSPSWLAALPPEVTAAVGIRALQGSIGTSRLWVMVIQSPHLGETEHLALIADAARPTDPKERARDRLVREVLCYLPFSAAVLTPAVQTAWVALAMAHPGTASWARLARRRDLSPWIARQLWDLVVRQGTADWNDVASALARNRTVPLPLLLPACLAAPLQGPPGNGREALAWDHVALGLVKRPRAAWTDVPPPMAEAFLTALLQSSSAQVRLLAQTVLLPRLDAARTPKAPPTAPKLAVKKPAARKTAAPRSAPRSATRATTPTPAR